MLRLTLVLALTTALAYAPDVRAMCGCMLPPRPDPKKGETKAAKIVNRTAKVILARDGDRTVMTMANDFEGAPAEFGIVIPVPSKIEKKDVKVVEPAVFTQVEDVTAPRVVEIFEPDPCELGPRTMGGAMPEAAAPAAEASRGPSRRAADYGVKVESHFFAGEYEIAVLAGNDASGLVKWLQLFNYEVPDRAQEVLAGYIKQKMHFFVARVYVKEMGNERRTLRPIQVGYNTPKYMLPIRLGMVNADGPQELLAFFLTKNGRVEPTNYRAVRMPSGGNLPHFAKDAWTEVYGAMFDTVEQREDQRVVLLEHAGYVGEQEQWLKAGAHWGGQVFATRAHFRYTEDKFPEDLVLQTTNDQSQFAVSWNAIKPANSSCPDPGASQRRAREQQTLANATGWAIEEVRRRAGGDAPPPPPKDDKWYQRLWK